MTYELREDQDEAVAALGSSLRKGNAAPILVSATGSGKTVIAMHIIKLLRDRQKRILFLAPRRELIHQTSNTFTKSLISHGIIMAGEGATPHSPVQIGSFDTLHSRVYRHEIMDMPEDIDFVFVDEAHLSLAETRSTIINHYREAGARIIGLTATPARGDGRGMGEIYDDLVQVRTVADLIAEGALVQPVYYGADAPDLKAVKRTKEDYVITDLEKVMDRPKLIGDIYRNWSRIAPDKSTVIFCTTVNHSRHVQAEFHSHGITCEHVDANTPTKERKEIMERLRSGQTQVLTNVFIASYGLDVPRLECAVMARPTKSLPLYIQMGGRVLRPFEGKTGAIIIDHGAVH